MSEASLPAMPKVRLSLEQEEAVKAIVSREAVFLSGPSGSGKNTALCASINYLEADGVRTGRCSISALAAGRIGGTTIHSFFKLPFGDLIKDGKMAVPDISKLMDIDVLIVNYANTCSALIIDIIWEALEMAERKGHHVQAVFSGDILAAGPVMDKKTMSAYEGIIGHRLAGTSPIHAKHWDDLNLRAVCLTQDMMGREPVFFQALCEIRTGNIDGLSRLCNLISPAPLKEGVWVCANKEEARKKNEDGLASISGIGCNFEATFSSGADPESFPSPRRLCLKEGAPIIVTANIPEKGLSSGMLGHVVRICGKKVYAAFPGRRGRILIPWHNWTDEKGSWFCQLPIDLGFAVTIYKARYLHLDAVNANNPSLIPGFIYTLASRASGPKKLYIGFPLTAKRLKVDEAVCRWHRLYVLQATQCAPGIPESIPPIEYRTRDGLRFGLYTAKCYQDVVRTFICLRRADGIICGVLDLQGHLSPAKKPRDIHSDMGDNAYFVNTFLNFAMIDSPERVDSIGDIDQGIIRSFMNAYGMGAYGRPGASHTKGTIEKCINIVFRFLTELVQDPNLHLSYTLDDLVTERYCWSARHGVQKRLEMAFEVLYDPEDHVTIRDMPPVVVQEMLSIAYQEHPDILMNLALGLCGGLRPSETCAISMDSIKIMRSGGKIRQISIDLEHTAPLRSDGVPTGEVKRPRMALIPSLFHDLFMACYARYMEWREAQPSEEGFRPLCLDHRGMAMTYGTFLARFKDLMRDTASSLAQSTDPKAQDFLAQYHLYGCSPHVTRHIYSVNLVLAGYDESMLMNARGDKSVESATVYLRNKGILLERTNATSELLTRWILEAAERFHKGGKKRCKT